MMEFGIPRRSGVPCGDRRVSAGQGKSKKCPSLAKSALASNITTVPVGALDPGEDDDDEQADATNDKEIGTNQRGMVTRL
jgi:hypothetical protein